MATIVIILIALIFFIIFALNDNGCIVKDYYCPRCTSSPMTYVPMQTKPPKCHHCGQYMEEYNDF